MGTLLSAISTAFDVVAAEEKAAREARYNSPSARGARSARSLKAAATVRARRAAEEAKEADRWGREPTGPVCGLFGIIPLPYGPHETTCVRPPHRHGDHENIDGDRWPTYDEEFDDMLTVTTRHLRVLLTGPQEKPALYVERDEDTGEPVRLGVQDERLVPHRDIIAQHEELIDGLGGPDHPDDVTEDALENLLPEYQTALDDILAADEISDGGCVLDGEVYPEHDYPAEGEGNECRRCGAEADHDGPDGVYDGEVR
jgi:hypothetical protein